MIERTPEELVWMFLPYAIGLVVCIVATIVLVVFLSRKLSAFAQRGNEKAKARQDVIDQASSQALEHGAASMAAQPDKVELEREVSAANTAIEEGHGLLGASTKRGREAFFGETLPHLMNLTFAGMLYEEVRRGNSPANRAPELPTYAASKFIPTATWEGPSASVDVATSHEDYAATGRVEVSEYFYSQSEDSHDQWFVGQSLGLTVMPRQPHRLGTSVLMSYRPDSDPDVLDGIVSAALAISPAGIFVRAGEARHADKLRKELAVEDGVSPDRVDDYQIEPVDFGDAEFEGLFSVRSADRMAAGSLLTQKRRQELLAFARDCGGFHAHFHADGSITLVFPRFELFDEKGFDGLPREMDAERLILARGRLLSIFDRLPALWD